MKECVFDNSQEEGPPWCVIHDSVAISGDYCSVGYALLLKRATNTKDKNDYPTPVNEKEE
jgi:hypothetical protein